MALVESAIVESGHSKPNARARVTACCVGTDGLSRGRKMANSEASASPHLTASTCEFGKVIPSGEGEENEKGECHAIQHSGGTLVASVLRLVYIFLVLSIYILAMTCP